MHFTIIEPESDLETEEIQSEEEPQAEMESEDEESEDVQSEEEPEAEEDVEDEDAEDLENVEDEDQDDDEDGAGDQVSPGAMSATDEQAIVPVEPGLWTRSVTAMKFFKDGITMSLTAPNDVAKLPDVTKVIERLEMEKRLRVHY